MNSAKPGQHRVDTHHHMTAHSPLRGLSLTRSPNPPLVPRADAGAPSAEPHLLSKIHHSTQLLHTMMHMEHSACLAPASREQQGPYRRKGRSQLPHAERTPRPSQHLRLCTRAASPAPPLCATDSYAFEDFFADQNATYRNYPLKLKPRFRPRGQHAATHPSMHRPRGTTSSCT